MKWIISILGSELKVSASKSICSELLSSRKSPKSAEFAQKHARSKLSTATVNQPIVRKPRLFSGVDFARLLLFFHFLFYFRGFEEANCLRLFPVPLVPLLCSMPEVCGESQGWEEASCEVKPVPPDLEAEEKPVGIWGGLVVWVDLEPEEVHNWPIFHFCR